MTLGWIFASIIICFLLIYMIILIVCVFVDNIVKEDTLERLFKIFAVIVLTLGIIVIGFLPFLSFCK